MEPEHQNSEPAGVEKLVAEPHRLHQVTPLSKYLAMTLFVILPFVGGWIGYTYVPEQIIEVPVEIERVVVEERVVENVDEVRSVDKIVTTGWEPIASQYNKVDLIESAPLDCLPTGTKFINAETVAAMSELQPGKMYGAFTYVGYDCKRYFKYDVGWREYPTLYFEGVTTLTGESIRSEMAGPAPRLSLIESDQPKIPNLGQSLNYDDIDGWSEGMVTLFVDGLVIKERGGGYQYIYDDFIPNIVGAVAHEGFFSIDPTLVEIIASNPEPYEISNGTRELKIDFEKIIFQGEEILFGETVNKENFDLGRMYITNYTQYVNYQPDLNSRSSSTTADSDMFIAVLEEFGQSEAQDLYRVYSVTNAEYYKFAEDDFELLTRLQIQEKYPLPENQIKTPKEES